MRNIAGFYEKKHQSFFCYFIIFQGLPEIQPTIDPTDLSTTESIDDILLNFQTSPDPFDLFDFLQTTKDPIFEELLLTTPATNIEEDFDFAALATTESIDALLATEPVKLFPENSFSRR